MPKLFRFEVDADLFGGDPRSIASLMIQFANGLMGCPSNDIRDMDDGKPFRGDARDMNGDDAPSFACFYVTEGTVSNEGRVPAGQQGTCMEGELQVRRGTPAEQRFDRIDPRPS